jgi:hypothetical protein
MLPTRDKLGDAVLGLLVDLNDFNQELAVESWN